MTNKIKSAIRKGAIATLGLAGLAMPMQTKADEPSLEPSYEVRTRFERTEDQNDTKNLSKFTLGVTPLRSGEGNTETFRAYEYQGDKVHYFTASAKIRAFSLAGITNDITFLGSTGTREDIGAKQVLTFGDFKLDMEAEQERTALGKSSRLGGGLDYYLNQWTFSVGFDSVSTPKDNINSPSASVMCDITKNDQAGIGFKRTMAENDSVNSIAGFYMHWGKDATWGTRTSAKYSWNEKKDIETFTWQSIMLTGVPTFSHNYGALATRRDYGYWFASDVAENPVETVERQYPGKRTKGGIVLQSDGQITINQGVMLGYLKNHFAYTFPLGKGNFSPGLFQRYDFDAKCNAHTVGATSLLRTPVGKKTNIQLEFSVGKRVSGNYTGANRDYELYGNVQLARRF